MSSKKSQLSCSYNPSLSSGDQRSMQEDIEDQEMEEEEEDDDVYAEVSPGGRYARFYELIGRGAFKNVYKAMDKETGCEIAWSSISVLNMTTKQSERLAEEINLLYKIDHPNIINLLDVWENKEKKEIVFITKMITGGSLKNHLTKMSELRFKVLKNWAKEILRGLEYLHNQEPDPIVHRDIKCDNIFINSHNGSIRIGDLGLASILKNDKTGSVLGTPEYMAPEIFEEEYGKSVDIYAFGMCLLEMATRERPYSECKDNPMKIYKKISEGIKPRSLVRILDKSLKEFIEMCLQEASKRPSAKDLLSHPFLTVESEADNQVISLGDMFDESSDEEIDEIEESKFEEKSDEQQSEDSPPQNRLDFSFSKRNSTENLSKKENNCCNISSSFKNISNLTQKNDGIQKDETGEMSRGKGSELESIKIEIQNTEFLVFKDDEMIESIRIDSLTSSNINDISKTIKDKLNISLDTQLYIESKLGSALRTKEARLGKLGRQLDANSSRSCSEDENDLGVKMQRFRYLYKELYLNEMDHWYLETIHHMDIRHESEINELRRMHIEQKQSLFEELRKRREVALNVETELAKNKNKNKRTTPVDYEEDTASQLQFGLDSYSVQSMEFSLKEMFSGKNGMHSKGSDVVQNNTFSCRQTPTNVTRPSKQGIPLRQQELNANEKPPKNPRFHISLPQGVKVTQPKVVSARHNKPSKHLIPSQKDDLSLKNSSARSLYHFVGLEKKKPDLPNKEGLHLKNNLSKLNEDQIVLGIEKEKIEEREARKTMEYFFETIKDNKQVGPAKQILQTSICETEKKKVEDCYTPVLSLTKHKIEVQTKEPATTLMQNILKREKLADILIVDSENNNINDVNFIQAMLSEIYPESQIMPNGYYGKFTAHYIKKFQEEIGIESKGVVCDETFFKLRDRYVDLHTKKKKKNVKNSHNNEQLSIKSDDFPKPRLIKKLSSDIERCQKIHQEKADLLNFEKEIIDNLIL